MSDGRATDGGVAGGESSDVESSGDERIEGVADASMIVRERETEQGLMVALCDGDVLGETFEEGEFSLTVTEDFYGGDPVDRDGAVDSLQRATIANIVGNEAVDLAIEVGIVDEANVLELGETRHAQLLRLY